ncbi:MAG: T9SS type A sorting domain-containing protein [candidate division WOR-3 bacterium]|nr:T9SS type A sorting domain-containing protein [candidate division WOR-3 bacterium]
MTRVAAFLIMLVAIAVANPILEKVYISEFQTSPDSLERIELRPELDPSRYPFEIGGAQIVTNAGTATVDSGVCFETWNSLVVIDSTNTTGTFSLGDDSDYIRLYVPCDNDTLSFSVRYPGNPHWTSAGSWVPPMDASASLYSWDVYIPPYEDPLTLYTWYIDRTPTFGAGNDDYGGGIWGGVFDQDTQAISGATVRVMSAYGTSTMQTGEPWWYGPSSFEQRPTGPGTFTVTAECPGYLPYTYPESIELAPNEGREIYIFLDPVGGTEEAAGKALCVGLHQRGRTLVLTANQPGTALVTVHDNLGRVMVSEKVALVSGSNQLALPRLSSGVYFAGCRFGEQTLNTKFVLY